MMIDATILLIQSYSTTSIKVDKQISLEKFMGLAGLQDHILFAPKFFILKKEKPLEGNEDGFFFAIRPKKKGGSIPGA